jgi:hypothetical protein
MGEVSQMDPKAVEPYGAALLSYFAGDTGAALILHRDDGLTGPASPRRSAHGRRRSSRPGGGLEETAAIDRTRRGDAAAEIDRVPPTRTADVYAGDSKRRADRYWCPREGRWGTGERQVGPPARRRGLHAPRPAYHTDAVMGEVRFLAKWGAPQRQRMLASVEFARR